MVLREFGDFGSIISHFRERQKSEIRTQFKDRTRSKLQTCLYNYSWNAMKHPNSLLSILTTKICSLCTTTMKPSDITANAGA